MEEKSTIYFGIGKDFQCEYIGESNWIDINQFNGSSEYVNIIARTEQRKSNSKYTTCYKTKILSPNLELGRIIIDSSSINDFSVEYWWTINEDDIKDRVWGYQPPFFDRDFSLNDSVLLAKFFENPCCSEKFCFVQYQDSRGYKRRIACTINEKKYWTIEGLDDIQIIINGLISLSKYKTFDAFKMYTILEQIVNFGEPDEIDIQKPQKYIKSVIVPLFVKCQKESPDVLAENPVIEILYQHVLKQYNCLPIS